MASDRASFLEFLIDRSYCTAYNMLPVEETGLPLYAKGEFFSRDERYWLSKSIPIWGNEKNELVYVFAADSFDAETAGRCIDYALADGLPKVKPHKEHQYTNIKTVFVADSFDTETQKYIKKRNFSKSYKFSLHGFSTLKTAAVDLSTEKTVTNSAGYELEAYFKRLFAAWKKSMAADR